MRRTIPSNRTIHWIARRAAIAAHHECRRQGGTILEAQLLARYAAKRAVAGLQRWKRWRELEDARLALTRWREHHDRAPWTTGLRLPQHRAEA